MRALVGSGFSTISPLLEKCAATSTHHRLAQGWANACNTRVERLLRLLRKKSDCPIIHTIFRSFIIFRTRFEQFLWRSKEPVGQAVSDILYTDTRLQFAAIDTASTVFVASQQRPIIHGDRISITYSTTYQKYFPKLEVLWACKLTSTERILMKKVLFRSQKASKIGNNLK